MNNDELILCSLDVPMVIDPQGGFDFPWANRIYEDLERLVNRLRLTPGEKNTSPAQAAKRGTLYKNIHLSSRISHDGLRFVFALKDTSGNLEMDYGGTVNQLVDLVNKYLTDGINMVSSTRSNLIYVVLPHDMPKPGHEPDASSALVPAKDPHDAALKKASMDLASTLPSGTSIAFHRTTSSGDPKVDRVVTEHQPEKRHISVATKQALAMGAHFPVEGAVIGHHWAQGVVYLDCDEPALKRKGINVKAIHVLESLKDAYCHGQRRVTLMIRKDERNNFYCDSVVPSGTP